MSWQRQSPPLGSAGPRWTGPYPAPLPIRNPDKPLKFPKGCGTDDGWHTHRRHGEPPCWSCEDAHSDALEAWQKARDIAAGLIREED